MYKSEVCEQNGDKVSNNDQSCHICVTWLKGRTWKIWDSVYKYVLHVGVFCQDLKIYFLDTLRHNTNL